MASRKSVRTLRASEIGTFLYCQRAWWYQQRGEPSQNQVELAGGSELHARHGRQVFEAGCLQSIAYFLLVAALVALAVYATGAWLQ